jgi:hypothetical protein
VSEATSLEASMSSQDVDRTVLADDGIADSGLGSAQRRHPVIPNHGRDRKIQVSPAVLDAARGGLNECSRT